MSGEQYALPEAVELVRAVKRKDAQEILVLSAVDRANLYGPVFPCPVTRRPETLLVLRGGRPLVALEGTTLRPLTEFASDTLAQAVQALAAQRRGRKLIVEKWEEASILGSPADRPLRDAGFYSDGFRLIYDGYPGPKHQ